MESPKAAGTAPKIMEVEAGEYWWCACGLSDHQPFCDGGHKGTRMGPQKFVVEEKQTVAFCLCKQSKNPPFCDGSHGKL
jgi:CDGSH-type Zn-finger protein